MSEARAPNSESGAGPAPIRFGPFTLDLAGARLLDAAGAEVALTRGQFAMLQALATRPGRVLTREFLSGLGCSTGAEPYERGVDMTIMRLRKRLEDDPKRPRLIVTVPGFGYRFDMPRPATAPAAPRVAAEAAASAPVVPPASRAQFGRRRFLAAGLGGALLAAGAGALVWRRTRSLVGDEGPGVVVQPFTETPPGSGAYLGRGVAGEIATLLATFPGVRVLAAMEGAEAARPASLSAARSAHAAYVLDGTVARSPNGLRISAQLVRVATGEYVWATRFEAAGSDPFALQSDVAERVYRAVAGFDGRLMEEDERSAWRRNAPDLSEYDYYLRGYETFWAFTKEGFLRAREVWKEGLERFPNSALLMNKIAWTYVSMPDCTGVVDPADIAEAWEWARRSREVHARPKLAEWLNHFILCSLYQWRYEDFRRSVEEAEAAQAMVPHDAHSRGHLCFWLANAGDLDRAVAWGEWALTHSLKPKPMYHTNLAWAHYLAGRPEQSLATLRDFGPDVPVQYAALLARLGRIGEARAQLARMPFRDTIANERLWPLRADLEEAYLNDLRAAGMAEV